MIQLYYDSSLERSQVPWRPVVYLVDILPQSIKKLTLLNCSENILHQLDEFVEQSLARFPALKTVILTAKLEWVVKDFTHKQK
jgi:hypothetical protein